MLYQKEKRSKSWIETIEEQRKELIQDFSLSKNHEKYAKEYFYTVYEKAKREAAKETGLSISMFPDTPPFTFEEALYSFLS